MGRRQINEIVLTKEEREYLIKNTKVGNWSPRKVKRAQILLKADRTNELLEDKDIAEELHCSQSNVTKLRGRFIKERLDVLDDKERSGRPKIIDGSVEAHITAIACSEAPKGRERWTLRLIADKVVTLTDIDSCSHVSVRNALKKTNLNLGKGKSGKSRRRQTTGLSGEWKKS